MEPLSALGLVCNILQLVDAAGKAYNVCHEIHTLGASIEDQRMTYTSEQLKGAYTALKNSLSNPTNTGSQVLPSQVDLGDLGSRCYETARALHKELLALRKKPDGGLRESVKVFVKKKKEAKSIEQIKTRLDEYQKVLDTKILIDLRQHVAQQTGMSDEIQQQLKELSQYLSSFHSKSSDHLSAGIAKAIQTSEEQQVRTRTHVSEAETHITSRLQNMELSQERQQRLQQQRKQLLESLTFAKTNLRMNEIALSHPDTFQWIFDDDSKRPWDSFTTWLKGDEPIYWIHGKPGSGKSTLMKFLANESRTRDCLTKWCPDNQVLIVKYYFWLSGSPIQRSLKGFLCSIVRQTIVDDKPLLDRLLNEHPNLREKRNINDWDPMDLRTLLIRLTRSSTRPICYLIDGLDEFDQSDDVENVLSLIEEISSTGKTKLCVSSRPENYISTRLSRRPQLRLQDLTAADMNTLICDELSNARSKCNPASIDNEHMGRIVWAMARKADGVFLWVHYAIKSLVTGMRNEDNFEDLLNRIEDLPSEMNQLYLQMWNRLNEDRQRYRDEAATYFSYCIWDGAQHFDDYGPISLFEMVVALSDSLQRMYIDRQMPSGHVDVAEQCERLKILLLTRCAGLLETVIDDENDIKYGTQYRRLAWEESHSLIQRMSLEGHLLKHHKTKVKFIHRTAREFLFDSHEGRSLLGQPKESRSLRCQNLLKASMAFMIQGLEPFWCLWVVRSMRYITHFCKESEIELVVTLNHLCERLSIPGIPSHNIGYQSFWMSHKFRVGIRFSRGFEGAAASAGCEQYVQGFLQEQNNHFSPYHLGFSFITLGDGLRRDFYGRGGFKLEQCSYWLSMTSWLISNGADLRAKHMNGARVVDVASLVLSDLKLLVLSWRASQQYTEISSQVAKQATCLIQQLCAALAGSHNNCLLRVNTQLIWRDLTHWSGYGDPWADVKLPLVVRCSATNLCWLTAQLFDPPVSSKFPPSQPLPRRDGTTRVSFSGTRRLCKVFNNEDSILLGQKLEDLWCAHADPSISKSEALKGFVKKLQEVEDRSTTMDINDWELENGMRFKEEDLIYTLDPSEDVDESNWMERGWFRKYDARDELHRSQEKLKMIERMQQFPHENWG